MKVLDLGRTPYRVAWETQKQIAGEVVMGGEDTLIFVEHEPVLTLGAGFHESNLLHPVSEYERLGIEVLRTDRGGDVTYHGPGQLVIYPIFDLKRHRQDLHKWLRALEQVVIETLATFEVNGRLFPPNTGVWVEIECELKKIAAIGIKVSKWVSLHGIALNCDNDLSAFDLIVPCGIHDHGVTSLSLATGKNISVEQAKVQVEIAFRRF